MHTEHLEHWQHTHTFGTDAIARGERRTRWVVGITLAMMVAEIAAGLAFGSMALLADGWHMGTHAAALGVAAFAYAYARRHARDPRYSFGTGKVGALGGFASAVGLAVVALLVFGESAARLARPVSIRFDQAIGVAVLGLLVNLGCALLLRDHDHGHDEHHHDHDRRDHDATTTLTSRPRGPLPPRSTATTTSAPPTCTCWRTRSPRCSPSRRCSPGRCSAGAGWTRSWGSSARW